jgi:hypothetical protein
VSEFSDVSFEYSDRLGCEALRLMGGWQTRSLGRCFYVDGDLNTNFKNGESSIYNGDCEIVMRVWDGVVVEAFINVFGDACYCYCADSFPIGYVRYRATERKASFERRQAIISSLIYNQSSYMNRK